MLSFMMLVLAFITISECLVFGSLDFSLLAVLQNDFCVSHSGRECLPLCEHNDLKFFLIQYLPI